MGVFTGYPTFDGEAVNLFKGTWTAARDAASSDSVNTTNTVSEVRGETGYHCGRAFFTFDLSSIPATATIDSATLRITVTSETAGDTDHGTLHLVETSPASTSALVTADFNNLTFTSFGSVSTNGATGDKTFTINATGITYLQGDIGGDTTLGVITKKDLDNTTPTGSGNMNVGMVDNATEGNRPLLTINYTAPGGGSNAMFFTGGGVTIG